MLLLALTAAFMPAHAAALNDLSSTPPVSLTMQPRNLPVAAAVPVELADALDELLVPPVAELWLLPHAAMTTVADTASAAVAHALRFTLTSTGPARGTRLASHIHPGLSRRLCLVIPAGKGPRGYLARSLPNRNPARMALLACPTEIRGRRPGFLVLYYILRAAGE